MRKEDQDRINRFSRLHSREVGVAETLKTKEVGLASVVPIQDFHLLNLAAEGEGRP